MILVTFGLDRKRNLIIQFPIFVQPCTHQKEIFDLKERHDTNELDLETPNKNFFTNNLIMDVSVFIIAIILVITTMIILYVLCKHNKLRTLVDI